MNEVTAHARRSDVETSHEAAATVRVKADAKKVLDWIGLFSERHYTRSFTHKEMVRFVGDQMKPQGVRSRTVELRESGYVEWAKGPDGEQEYDWPDAGRRSRRMRLTPKGWEAYQNDQEIVLVKKPRKPSERDKILAAVQQAGDERGTPETTKLMIARALEILG